MNPKQTHCKTCPYYLESYKEHLDRPVHYCRGRGKNNARRIKKKELHGFPPDWCPKYIQPPKLRIYTPTQRKKESDLLNRLYQTEGHSQAAPSAFDYELRLETDSPISAYTLYNDVKELTEWRSVWLEDVNGILGTEVYDDEVLEIDDGINPCFLYLDTREDFVLRMILFSKAYAGKKKRTK